MGSSEPGAEAAKRALREEMRSARKRMGAERRRIASAAICLKLLGLQEYRDARTVMGYCASGTEADLGEFLRAALADGKRLLLPLVTGPGRIEAREVRDLGRDLAPGAMGLMEPTADCAAADPAAIDLVAAPALAVADDLMRLGQGGGFYDRFLPSASCALKVAAVFAVQRTRSVPHAEHDAPVDRCLTEAEEAGEA